MKVFLSWSGERSKLLAHALRDWLPLVLHYVEPWVSESDIDAGARWGDEVAKQLDGCNFGIICVTKENIEAPWILFEAGALAKMLDGSRLIPVLLDLDFREVAGPLAQFQGKKVDRAGLLEVVQSINNFSPSKVAGDRFGQLFNALYSELESKVLAIPKSIGPAKHSRSQAEVLEELVTSIRAMETKIRESGEGSSSSREVRQLHPEFLYELMRTVGGDEGDPIILLMIAGLYRENFPWLAEIMHETYRKYSDGKINEARDLLEKFMVATRISRRMGLRGELMKDQEFMLERFLPQLSKRFSRGISSFQKIRESGTPDQL